ncbi:MULTISPECIES: hypothetical protein [Thalassomonas]|uniref:Uncharacterized protein n=1 Tax=Thalassomonas actiniarum TaxID=485447 RepID=A0AAE9YYV7_9GAMM|nr:MULTISPECIES: hypothetical protein [Thalassomonas]WDE02162.1 hypothetical protein SG35_030875 [Thalassomonas actiniarum]
MKLQLNKKKLKNLSKDKNALPAAMTPQIAGGRDTRFSADDYATCPYTETCGCQTSYLC